MRHKEIIEKMTLKEKAAFLSGKNEWETRDIPRLDIPSIFCADGPNGVRKQAGQETIWVSIPQCLQPAFLRLRLWQTAGTRN